MEYSADETAIATRLSRNKKRMQIVKSTDCSNEEEEEEESANWEIQSVSCEVIEGRWSVEIDL